MPPTQQRGSWRGGQARLPWGWGGGGVGGMGGALGLIFPLTLRPRRGEQQSQSGAPHICPQLLEAIGPCWGQGFHGGSRGEGTEILRMLIPPRPPQLPLPLPWGGIQGTPHFILVPDMDKRNPGRARSSGGPCAAPPGQWRGIIQPGPRCCPPRANGGVIQPRPWCCHIPALFYCL